MISEINIAPVKFSNLSALKKITEGLKENFSSNVNLIYLDLDIEPALSSSRLQYYSTQIICDAIKLTGDYKGKVVLITEADIYVPVLTFIFGEAQLDGKHSIVSVCRLHEEFYEGRSNDELLLARSLKEILHELGHNFGLKHCNDWDCVMHASLGIEEVDIKGKGFCKKCAPHVEGYKQVSRF